MNTMNSSELVYHPATMDIKSTTVTVEEIVCSETDSSSFEAYSKPHSFQLSRQDSRFKPSTTCRQTQRVDYRSKLKEYVKITRQILNQTVLDTIDKRHSISEPHQYARRIVSPLFTWGGKNTRVLTGQSVGMTTIQDGQFQKKVIQAASHNYMGFYMPTPESEEIHRQTLQHLPVTASSKCLVLERALHTSLTDFLSADFALTTSTGYGSNLLAFPAILDPNWIAILDEKCHNSMNVGCYMSDVHKVIRFRHNDMDHLETILTQYSQQHHSIMVAVEGLYSMDGTIPPLQKLAKLKARFDFVLLVDEAHSFLSVGSTGRGCLELWNETYPESTVNSELIDVRTATLSKSLASIGGLVCGKAKFKEVVYKQAAKLEASGTDPVLTATMVQCLHILNQPTITRHRSERMNQVITYTRKELERFGIHIYGDACTPVLPIHCGPPSLASEMSYVLRTKGILATPVSKPAVDFWESRIRVCLSADHTDEMINTLVRGIITAAQEIGIIKATGLQPRVFSSQRMTESVIDISEAQTSFYAIADLIAKDKHDSTHSDIDQDVLRAGHLARQKFGVAAGGSRWISGTFTVHEELESLIAQTIDLPDAMTYADNYIGLSSTIAALCRPLHSYKKYEIFIPQDACTAVQDGIKIAPKKHTPTVKHYTSLEDVNNILMQYAKSAGSRSRQITLALDLSGLYMNLSSLRKLQAFHTCRRKILPGLTVLLYGSEDMIQSREGQQNLRDIVALLQTWTKNILVYGSFYASFGIPGAFLAGSAELIEELRYSSRGYMFTTAPLPFTVAMNLEYLKQTAS